MKQKKINLEKILTSSFNGKYWDVPFRPCEKAMLEFGRQLLELAAENAYVKDWYMDDKLVGKAVDKQSILDTINQLE